MEFKLNLERFYPIGEIEQKFPISAKTMRNWRSAGKYPQLFATLGGRVYVDLIELERTLLKTQQIEIEKSKKLERSLNNF